MTASNQNVTVTVQLTGITEGQAQAIVTQMATSIQTALTAHGIGGSLSVSASFSEAIAP